MSETSPAKECFGLLHASELFRCEQLLVGQSLHLFEDGDDFVAEVGLFVGEFVAIIDRAIDELEQRGSLKDLSAGEQAALLSHTATVGRVR